MAKDRHRVPAKETASSVDSFLAKVKATPPPAKLGSRGRLIFAMDATMSREPSWDRAIGIQSEMFNAAADLGGLDVQLVWFRGFGEFSASPWASDAKSLGQAMTRVGCRGGHTQIGRVLNHALQETKTSKVNALVYVGDCVEENVDDLAATAGQLGLLGLPSFLFQDGGDGTSARAFQEIARLTGGAYCHLDAGSATRLKDLLRAVAVYASGGHTALTRIASNQSREVQQLITQVKR
ncbi:MAG: VWA domain-containing protein [Rhodobiaceae bacterium]|nr:VWA domain-containing protein [Rhodobiaceae bacterium]